MDGNNQRSWKSRHHQEAHSQRQAKRLEDLHTAQGAVTEPHPSLLSSSSSIPAAPEVKLVNADMFRHRYSPVNTADKAAAASQVKMQRGSSATVFHPGMAGQVVMMKQETATEAFSPAVESLPLPSHTTKSSSLSRDISPSRITAQVVSAMSESSQPLLLSALTGKMPAPVMLGNVPRPDPAPDGKPKKGEATGRGSSPYRPERRPSPLHSDGGVLGEGKGVVKGHHPVSSTLPFENLMRAAALAQAQELHGRSSPVRLSVQSQQGSVSMHSEGRTRTPSPKSTSLSSARSPQRHGGVQGQRRSPLSTGSRPSPAPSPVQEGMAVLSSTATLSGGVIIPLQQMGLVQQHLLAATIASTTTTTTTTIATTTTSISTTYARSAPSPHHHHPQLCRPGLAAVHHPKMAAVPAGAPSVVSHSQPGLQLSAVPVDMSTTPQQKSRSVKNSHVISVGTGTDLKQYASHGAQTRLVKAEEMTLKGEEGVVGKLKGEENLLNRAPHTHHKQDAVADAVVVLTPLPHSSSITRATDADQVGVMSTACRGQTMSDPPMALTEVRGLGRVSSSTFTPVSNTSSLHLGGGGGLNQTGKDPYKWHVPVPTAAHGNKPISAHSSHAHAHVHTHPPSSLPRPLASVPSSLCRAPMNAVKASAPLTHPTPSLSHAPITSARVQTVSSSVEAAVLRAHSSTAVSSSVGVGVVSSSAQHYQPHHHHYSQHSPPPAQTVTSQTAAAAAKSGPVVKDFVPVVGPPEPPPYHHRHHNPHPPPPPLPSHINPFTFPTSGVKVHDIVDDDRPTYSLIGRESEDRDVVVKKEMDDCACPSLQESVLTTTHKSVSDLSGFRKVSDFSRSERQEMPRLTPEGCMAVKCEVGSLAATFNHVDSRSGDAKEQLINPFNQRLQNLNNFPTMATAYRSAYRSQSVAMQRAKAGIIMGSAKTLDLLRQNVQKSVNKELDQIVRRYVEKFFKPAAENIRQNNGADSVSEEHINTVCRQMLEEAKRMYSAEARRSMTPVNDFPDNVSETGSLNGRRVSPTPLSRRLKASDSDSEKGSDGGAPKKIPRRKGRPPLNSSGRSTPMKPVMKLDCIREGPKWDPERIRPETLFVMGARANKALGLGNTRGRLYIRHPDVFKYSGDQEDKVWLHDQKLLPATGGKAYLLLVEDIVDLSKTDDYKDSPTLMMHECRGFEVPEFMRIKIREAMRAMRADSLKRSRSRSPLGERPEPPKSLPFASFSDTASNNDVDSIGNKNSLQPSPADTEEMEIMSSMDNDDTQPSDISSFKMSGGFEDTSSHSPCPPESMDDEPSAPVASCT